MNILQPSYASDEDVALIAPADVGLLFPADQVIAEGVDGVFLPSDRWTLQSASEDFSISGLRPGHVVRLVGPPERFQPPGALLGVSEVSSGSVTLTRIGLKPGLGTPIAPSEGLTGVKFLATTLGPQFFLASREVDRLLGIDPANSWILPEDLDVLRDATVRLVLSRRYASMAGEGDGAFHARAESMRAEFDAIVIRMNLGGDRLAGRASRFGTRLER